MRITIRRSPIHGKMTEAAKAIICLLCEKRPWEGKTEQFRYKLPPEYAAERKETFCLIDISFDYSFKIGIFGYSEGAGSPITSLCREDGELYLDLDPEKCEYVFTPTLPKMLDLFNAWDDIVSREPLEDEDAEEEGMTE